MRSARILGIDDSLTIRRLFEITFTPDGHTVALEANGAAGVAVARERIPDLIFLDYVLPDMSGIEVCRLLADDPVTASIPVVLMSAKADQVREQFRDMDNVVEFVQKPFSASDLRHLLTRLRRHERDREDSAEERDALDRDDKQRLAQAIFSLSRKNFTKIPQWYADLGDRAPGTYFAQRFITPDFVDQLVELVRPLCRNDDASATSAAPTDAAATGLSGDTACMPLLGLLRHVQQNGRSGRLVVRHEDRAVTMFVQRGAIAMATDDQPGDFRSAITGKLVVVDDELRDRALRALAEEGRPIMVTLAEAGQVTHREALRVVHREGIAAILGCINAGPGRFTFDDDPRLPDFVDRYAQRITFEHLELERMRQVDDWTQIEHTVPSLEVRFRRAAGFGDLLDALDLHDDERTVLTLVNGRRTVKAIIDRSGLATFEVFHILFRLSAVGLIEALEREDEADTGSRLVEGRRCIGVVAVDSEAFAADLTNAVQHLGRDWLVTPLVAFAAGADPAQLPPPATLLVDDPSALDGVRAYVHALADSVRWSDTVAVAVVPPGCDSHESLLEDGFAAVLERPFHLTQLESLLST